MDRLQALVTAQRGSGRLLRGAGMAQKGEPSYADLVYEVLRSAGHPLRVQEILDEVNRRRPVTTRNPRATIHSALSQGKQLISLGDGHYGYLPHLVAGSLLRLPLTERKPARHPLVHPADVCHALWPSFLEIQKRAVKRAFQVRLPTEETIALSLEFLGPSLWGSHLPAELGRYLEEHRAAAGDSLLVRVDDAEAGRGEAWFEPRRQRDKAAVARRNTELADAAEQVLRASRSPDVFIWDLATALLARGLYRAAVAPDPLETVLSADRRFLDAGLSSWTLAAAVTSETLSAIRERKRMEEELFQPAGGPTAGAAEPPPPHAMRYAMERILADVGAALGERQFRSVEEANAFLQNLLRGGAPPRRAAETALERAQELMYEAWEAPDPRRRIRLAREALQLSPDCADAYVLLAEQTARSPQEAADLYAKGVAAGERALGPEALVQDAGHFWGLVETRPYMRARFGLAEALWAMGSREEAIGHAWDLLRLNPGDNQGVRDVLLSWLLEIGDDAQVQKLLGLYTDDVSAVWLYARALHAFRTEGDTKRARKLLADARKGNPLVPDYLAGRKRAPRRLPEVVGFGDESEAVLCAAGQLDAWRRTPGALTWLAEQAG